MKTIGKIFKLIADKKNKNIRLRKSLQYVISKNGVIEATDLQTSIRIKKEIETGFYNPELLSKDIIVKEEVLDNYNRVQTTEDTQNLTFDTDGMQQTRIEGNILIDKILKKIDFIKADCMSMAIEGVRIIIEDGILTAVNTDSYRILKIEEATAEKDCSFFLTAKTIKILKLMNNKKAFFIYHNKDYIIITNDIYTLKQTATSLPFPDFKNIYKNFYYNKTIQFKKDELITLLTKHLEISKNNTESKNAGLFEFNTKELDRCRLTSNSDTLKMVNIMECLNNFNDNFKIVLNVNFILEYLKTTKADMIEFKLNTKSSAVSINNDYIIMPLPMREE